MRISAAAFLIFVLAGPAAAFQDNPAPAPRAVRAVRADGPIAVDARLTEPVWQREGIRDFVQFEPENGEAPTEETEVWAAYDRDNVYFAARLSDSEPSLVRGLLGRRDALVDSDWFFVYLDPYHDGRTGYSFGITPAGSIFDAVLTNDFQSDPTWDGVWEGRAERTGEGWTVEIRVPLDQIRFQSADEQVWGVNFQRIIKRKNERLDLVRIRRDESAFVSRFARLEGIRGVRLRLPVEILPFSVGQVRTRPAQPGNPFQTGTSAVGNAGLDFKIGLKNNFSLSGTVNPDFGQVEVDPAVLNLSAFETYYDEKRPFFVEGSDIFQGFGSGGIYHSMSLSWPRPSFFYSRRIGRASQGAVASQGFVEIPDRTTILGAAKVTGRLGGGWNVGIIQALTSSENALIAQGDMRTRQEIEPLTYYGVFRLQNDFGQGRRGLGGMATVVARDLDDPGLGALLNKRAFSLAFDSWNFLDRKRRWVFAGWAGATRVEGSSDNILRLQTSPQHYFQRPDAGHVRVDPAATSISGWAGRFILAKQQGAWQYCLAAGAISPGFNPNDAGYMRSGADLLDAHVFVIRQWNKPGRVFRNVYFITGPYATFDFGARALIRGFHAYVGVRLLNYWNLGVFWYGNPAALDKDLTRGGPLVRIPGGDYFNLNWTSDDRRLLVFQASTISRTIRDTSRRRTISAGFRWKPVSHIAFSLGTTWGTMLNNTQWVAKAADPAQTATFGTRYVFGRLDQKTLSCDLRLEWIFTPKLSLQLYLQPFLAVGAYDRFKELAAPRRSDYSLYGEGDSEISSADDVVTVRPDLSAGAPAFTFRNPDFNIKSLRGTAVLRWEYRPGSLIYLVWTQNRSDYANPGDFHLGRDLGDVLTAPGDNIITLKISYRWGL